MQPITGGQLGGLHAVHQCKAGQLGAQCWSTRQNLLKNFRAHTYSISRHLHDGSKDFPAESHGQGHTHHSLLANDSDLDASAITAESDQRSHAVIEEIGELYLFAGLV